MNIRKKTALIAAAATAFVAVGCTANAKQWQGGRGGWIMRSGDRDHPG